LLLDASLGRVLQDDTKPTGSVTIEGGRASTRDRTVRLTLEATDPGPNSNGVSRMRIKNAGGAWTKWSPYEPNKTWIKIHMPTSRLGNDEAQGKSEGVVPYDDFRFLRKGRRCSRVVSSSGTRLAAQRMV
jgi:hypothetical protein